MEKLIYYVPVDDILDQVAMENIHSSLPPCLTEGILYRPGRINAKCQHSCHCCAGEKAHTVEVRGSEWRDGRVVGSEEKGVEFTMDTEVKLARYNAIR